MEIFQTGQRVFFQAQQTSGETLKVDTAITAFADNVTGTSTTVTAAGHSLVDGDYCIIKGTTSYNGRFKVSGVSGNDFVIQRAFVADDATGTVNTVFENGAGILWIPSDVDITIMVLKGTAGAGNDRARSGKRRWDQYEDLHSVQFKGVKGGSFLPIPCVQINAISAGTIGDFKVCY